MENDLLDDLCQQIFHYNMLFICIIDYFDQIQDAALQKEVIDACKKVIDKISGMNVLEKTNSHVKFIIID